MLTACKQTFCFVLLYFLLLAELRAQPRGKVDYYSTEQGLSHQRVTTIIKDHEGFMWFGSWDGINRFDGRSFASYKSSPGDKFQLGNDRIDRIVEDEKDHLWIQAYDRQVYRFDKKTEQFSSLSTILDPDGKHKIDFTNILAASNGWVWLQSADDGLFCVSQTELYQGRFFHYQKGAVADYRLPSNTVNFFYEDNEHLIWIGTPDGLCCLQRAASGTYSNRKITAGNIASGTNLTSVDEDAGQLYFGTADGALITYKKGAKTFSQVALSTGRINAVRRSKKSAVVYVTTSLGELIFLNLQDQKITTIANHPTEPLYTLYEDQTGGVWIEPQKLGVVRFDPVNRAFQSFSLTTTESLNYIGNRFRVLEDGSGTVWVNMKGGGFGYFNPVAKAMEYTLATPDGPDYKLPDIVYTIYYDTAGVFWLTTNERELVKILLQGNDFTQQLLVRQEAPKSDNEVRGVLYDNKRRLWVGAKRGNLFVYQNNVLLKDLFVNEPSEGLGGVYAILQDSRGIIWLGTKGAGLYKASPVNREETKYRLTHFQQDKNNPAGLPCNDIYALLEDKQGRIWVGSFDNGLCLIADDGSATTFIYNGEVFKNYPKGIFQKIRHMALDADGNLWIGTTNGLLIQNANERSAAYQYKTYSKLPDNKESLGNNDVQYVYRDSKNRMWLATSGGGFCHANGDPFQSLRFRNYTTKDGLANDYVLSSVEDGEGNLWIATENGLSKFNPQTEDFRNYDSYNGLPKVAFSEASAGREYVTGKHIFGTRHGYLTFEPSRILTNRIPAAVVFTNLQINNEDAGPGANETILKTDVNYISSLELKYDQNIISIDYAILDYRAGNRQPFAYRLVGFDTTWHDDRQARRATYTNLPPGHYVFEVKIQSTDLYSNKPYRRLAITILPPRGKRGGLTSCMQCSLVYCCFSYAGMRLP